MKRLIVALALAAGAAFPQATVTLNGTSYTTAPHPRTLLDGPSGFLTGRIKDPDGPGPLVAPKATSSNPAWVAMGNSVRALLAAGYTSNSYRSASPQNSSYAAFEFASYWYADNSQTAAHDAALYMLNHIEYYTPFVCVESVEECVYDVTGYGITSYGISYSMPSWVMAYELMRGEMTTAQRQTFASKILNDLSAWGGIDGAPGTSCTNPTQDSGATVTIAYPAWSGSAGTLIALTYAAPPSWTFTATLPSTTGLSVGASVTLQGTSTINGNTMPFNNTYQVLSVSGTQITFSAGPNMPSGSLTVSSLTLTYQEPFATASSPIFGTAVHSGDWIFTYANTSNTSAMNPGILDLIVDSTHAFITNPLPVTSVPEELYSRPQSWSPGQCGYIWHVKHDEWITQAITFSNGHTLYPPDGGQNGLDGGHNLNYSASWGLTLAFLAVLDDDVNAASRSAAELSATYGWWYANPFTNAENWWTGFHQTGSGYGLARTLEFMPGTAIALQNSLVNPPNLNMNGIWARNLMTLVYANTFPDNGVAYMQWGQPDVSGAFGNGLSSGDLIGFTMLAEWYRNTPEGQYANWWLQNIWAATEGYGNAPGSNTGMTAYNLRGNEAWFFTFTDSSYPTTTLAGSPTTFADNVSDTGTAGQRMDTLVSRTGYTSASDTLLNFYSQAINSYDHNVFALAPSNYGSYKIFKGHYLLAEDYNIDFPDPSPGAFTIGGTGSNYVEVGGAVNLIILPPIYSAMPRATGNNSYAYGMADVTAAYTSAAALQHGYRHLIDFKKPGTQQFIVDYVDFLTAGGKMKKAYYHYPNMATTSLSSNIVTSNNSNGLASQLFTQVLAPQPVLIAQDTSGTSFRLDVCPSLNGTTCDATNTQADMMVVHMPVAGAGNSLPAIGMLATVDSHFLGVEIDGTSPKVAVLARYGATYTSTSFTAAHTGTAQILIAGITPTATSGDNYTLLQNGVPVLEHTSVGADGTLYYEGTAGAYQLVAEAAPPSVATTLLPAGIQYQSYTGPLNATAGTLPLTWSISGGSLPAGLVLNAATGVIGGVPTASGSTSFTVQVTDALGYTSTASLSVTVTSAAPLAIQTTLLNGRAGFALSQTLAATGGGGLYQWSVYSGSLPSGLSLASNGLLSGTPLIPASGPVTVQVTDAFGNVARQALTITIVELPATTFSGAAVSGLTILH